MNFKISCLPFSCKPVFLYAFPLQARYLIFLPPPLFLHSCFCFVLIQRHHDVSSSSDPFLLLKTISNWIQAARSCFLFTLAKLTIVKCNPNNNITNRDGGAEVRDNEVMAEGIKRLKKFVIAVGTIATDGCRIDPAYFQGFI
jgi:hypothetical protein